MTMVEVLEDDTDKMEIDVRPTQQYAPARNEGLQLEPMTTTVPQDDSDVLNDDGEAPRVSSPIFSADDSSSFSSGRSMSLYGSSWSEDEDTETDNFTSEDEKACQPVIQIWLDLTAHLKEDEIPNPLEFIEQHKAFYM